MTREFERDSKIPLMAVLVGVVVSCFATWYAIHCAWEAFSPPGFDWCGHEACAVFKAARGTIVLSTMLSASIAILIRLVRSKDASTLGYLTAYTKLALVMFMAMRMSAVVGFSFGTFVPKSCAPPAVHRRMAVLSDCSLCGNADTNPGGIVFHGVSAKEVAGGKDMDWPRHCLRIAKLNGDKAPTLPNSTGTGPYTSANRKVAKNTSLSVLKVAKVFVFCI